MNTFKPTAPAGDPHYVKTIEAELAANGVDNFGPPSDDMWDCVVAMMVWMDGYDDYLESLKDELDLFRRENNFDLG